MPLSVAVISPFIEKPSLVEPLSSRHAQTEGKRLVVIMAAMGKTFRLRTLIVNDLCRVRGKLGAEGLDGIVEKLESTCRVNVVAFYTRLLRGRSVHKLRNFLSRLRQSFISQ